MKIFISWSGDRSKAIAELFNDWLRCVIQAAKPWVSSRDIDRGALWFNEVSGQLSDTSVGIVCLTSDNKTKPWILFEAGALAKGLSHTRVCTFLVDLKPADIEDPLAQFNHSFPTQDSLWLLVRTLNNLVQPTPLDERILLRVFETYWPQFDSEFKRILKEVPAESKPEKRSEQSILSEILSNTRGLGMKVRELEAQLEHNEARARRDAVRPVTAADLARFGVTLPESRSARDTAMDLAKEIAMKERIIRLRARGRSEPADDLSPPSAARLQA